MVNTDYSDQCSPGSTCNSGSCEFYIQVKSSDPTVNGQCAFLEPLEQYPLSFVGNSGSGKAPQPFTLDSNGHLLSNGLEIGADMPNCQFSPLVCGEQFPRGFTPSTFTGNANMEPLTCSLAAGVLNCYFSFVNFQGTTTKLQYAALQVQDFGNDPTYKSINGQQTVFYISTSFSDDVTLQAVPLSACVSP